MLTREERRRLEAEWSSDDRSMVRFARMLKASVLSVMVLGLVCMAASGHEGGQQTAAVTLPSATRIEADGSAMRASQQAYDARRAQWEAKAAAKPLQQAATR